MRRALPKVIETYWYAFDWDVEGLWALDLPTEALRLRELEWMLDIPAFPFDGEAYVLSPRDVLNKPARYAEEYARVERASLDYPIEITSHADRWVILDGCHRLMKAYELGRDSINVRKVPGAHLIFAP